MAYCVLVDLKKLLPEVALIQLTDDEGSGSINQGRIDEAISQADSEIDSYVGTRYSVPLSPVPTLIKKLSVDFAIYNLYSRKEEGIPETRETRYKNGIRLLEGIAKGNVTLGTAEDPPASEGTDQVSISSEDRIFTRDTLKGF